MKDYNCKCGAINEVELRPKGFQIGLYCKKCGRWIKWVSKDEAQQIEAREQSKRRTGLPEELVINGVIYIRKG